MSSSGINLNRFSGLTRQYLAGNVSFGHYAPAASTYQGSGSFSLAATNFSPTYNVNNGQQGGTSRYNGNEGLSFNGLGLEATPHTPLDDSFNRPIGLNSTGNGLSSATLSTTPANIPEKYAQFAALDGSISESQLDTLLSLDEFQLARLGLKVITDGAGGIDKVVLDTSSVGLLGNAAGPLNGNNIGLAQSTGGFELGFGKSAAPQAIKNGAVPNDTNLFPFAALSGLGKSTPKVGINPNPATTTGITADKLAALLQQRQPSASTVSATGPQATFGLKEARSLALVTNGTGLTLSSTFAEQLAQLQTLAAKLAGNQQQRLPVLAERLNLGAVLSPSGPFRSSGGGAQSGDSLQLQLSLEGGGNSGGVAFAQGKPSATASGQGGMDFGSNQQGGQGNGQHAPSSQGQRKPLMLIA